MKTAAGHGSAGAGRARMRLVSVLVTAAALAGCGWQLRGSYNIPPEIVPIQVDGGGVGTELRNDLRASNALAESTATPAASRVEILSEGTDRRVLSVDRNGKADEYEVIYTVRWQLTAQGTDDSRRRILIAPLTFRANRSYDFDSGELLSKSEEESFLVETMRDDIAQRILFRLQGASVGASEAGSGDGPDNDDADDTGPGDG